MTDIYQLAVLREREDHIEFKEAKHNYPLPEEVIMRLRSAANAFSGTLLRLPMKEEAD